MLLSLFWIAIVGGQINNPTKMSQWVFDAYQKKKSLSQQIQGKKVLIVSGSNALFGIDSKLLSKHFKLPVLNYGVNAGIELPLILHLAKRAINPGDIVLAPLEYTMYLHDSKLGMQVIDYLLAREPSFFWKLSFGEQLYLLSHITLKRVVQGYNYQGGEPITKGLYGAHHIDHYGDQINTSLKFKEPYMQDVILKHQENPERYGDIFFTNKLGWKYLEEFMKWANSNHVKIIFIPSTQMKDNSYFTNSKEKIFYENIAKEVRKRGWNYLGNPYNYMYKSSFYFNTNFHLTEQGRKIRTEQIIKDIDCK